MKKEDLTFSLLRSLAEIHGQFAHVNAIAYQVKQVYFTGSFINMELMRRFLCEEINGRNTLRPEVIIEYSIQKILFISLYPISSFTRPDLSRYDIVCLDKHF